MTSAPNRAPDRWQPSAITSSTTRSVDAGGTMWRLRSLVAMGHDADPDRAMPWL